MTHTFRRGDVVTTGDSSRTWTVRRIDGDMANLRDSSGVHCSVPVASLWLVRSAPPWHLCLATVVVIAFALFCGHCVWRIVDQRIALDCTTSAVLLAVAGASAVALMAMVLRIAWRRL